MDGPEQRTNHTQGFDYPALGLSAGDGPVVKRLIGGEEVVIQRLPDGGRRYSLNGVEFTCQGVGLHPEEP